MRYGILFFGLLFAAASQADGVAHYQDQRFGYVAGNLMNITLDYDNRELTPTGVGVRLGGMIDPYWGVELRAAVAPCWPPAGCRSSHRSRCPCWMPTWTNFSCRALRVLPM